MNMERNMQRMPAMCVCGAMVIGLMLLGMPFCMAHGLTTSTVSRDAISGESTQVRSTLDRSNDLADTKEEKKIIPTSKAKQVVKPAAKTFNMDMLIERLKKTDAIGIFTKLALRSDARDLMGMIKAYNKGIVKYSLKELRARFNGLVLKVLALLDRDPKLSRTISLAREEIWNNLLEVKA